MHRTSVCLLSACLFAPLLPSPAAACSGLICEDPWIRVGGAIPSNTPAIAIALHEIGTSAALFEETASGDVERAVEVVGAEVRFVDALTPGSWYRLVITSPCEADPTDAYTSEARFYVSEAEALPGALGTLEALAPSYSDLTVADGSGGCYGSIDAVSVDLEMQLEAGIDAWDGLLVWETYVDGERWHPDASVSWGNPYGDPGGTRPLFTSWRGAARDEVYAACGEVRVGIVEAGVGEGVHTAQIRAYVPGTDIVLTSNEVTFELECPAGDPEPEPDPDPERFENPVAAGCSVAPGAPAALSVVVLAVALVFAARSRRTR